MLQYAESQNSPVWPDIQGKDEDKNWDQAIALGLKGLQTDHPLLLINYLTEKGIR
jgi:glycerophosphoryl diester phosphodiesterase